MSQFYKSQLSSIIATSVDFITTIFLKEILGIVYLLANAIGMIMGGITHFLVNKKWTFKGSSKKTKTQVFRYIQIWILGFCLNNLGVWFFTQQIGWNYLLAKCFVSVIIAIGLNFYLQKKYVFK